MTDLTCLGDQLVGEWWKDKATLVHECAVHGSNRGLEAAHGHSESLYRRWRNRHGIEASKALAHPAPGPEPEIKTPVPGQEPGLRVDFKRGTATLVTDPQDIRENPDLGDVDQLVRERGLDPDEWIVDRVKVNEWQGLIKQEDGEPKVVTLRQLNCIMRRKPPLELIYPAVEVREHVAPKGTGEKAARLIACVGDQQANYHDEELHQAFVRWAADVQPTDVMLLGDTSDFPTISRHPDRPFWNSTPQACIDTAYRLLSEYRDAMPDAVMRKLRGNHDWRLESELLTRAERVFGLAPAAIKGDEQIPGYSIRRLLHLDALQIELIGREGDKWQLGEAELAPGLYARHQPPNQKKLLRLNRDVVAGDTHRQSIHEVTVFNDADEPVVRTVVEAGCMCRTDGLGYTEHPDWQPGFATVAIGADGHRSFELAVWRNGKLTWRGESW